MTPDARAFVLDEIECAWRVPSAKKRFPVPNRTGLTLQRDGECLMHGLFGEIQISE